MNHGTTSNNNNDLLEISNPRWGLDSNIIEAYAGRKLTHLYPWQAECLEIPGVLDGTQNLLYTAPTSAGKTLVAEILMFKRLQDSINASPSKPGKIIFILPFVSVVQEKHRVYKKMLQSVGSNLRVEAIHGALRRQIDWHDFDIGLCTMEKANILVNTAINNNMAHQLLAVIADEIHMLSDQYRGYIMELLLTKILALQLPIQVIGMSATLKNTEILAQWLHAKYFLADYRPIPLLEYVVCDNVVYNFQGTLQRYIKVFNPARSSSKNDSVTNAILSLVYETVKDNMSTIVFCSSRRSCVYTACLLASHLKPAKLGSDVLKARKNLLLQLANCPAGLDVSLEKAVLSGIAYNHAGMTSEEKELVEIAYDEGILKVLCATTTLAAGVNLPARRVILSSPMTGSEFLKLTEFRQMSGRAGRKGKDLTGESFLVCEKSQLQQVTNMLESDLPSIKSCLVQEELGLKRAVLEVIVSNLATSLTTLIAFAYNSLLAVLAGNDQVEEGVKAALEYLIGTSLVEERGSEEYVGTKLGQAIVKASLTPDDGLFLYGELKRAMRQFVLDDDLHLIYHVTPPYTRCEVNWRLFQEEFQCLSDSSLQVAKALTVEYGYIQRMATIAKSKKRQYSTSNGSADAQQEDRNKVHLRFYCALMLRQLVDEVPLGKVSERFSIERGFLQSLATSASAFASITNTFCTNLGWMNLALLLNQFRDRLFFGVGNHLLDLARLPHVRSYTARMFVNHGYSSVGSVAAIDNYMILVPLLQESRPSKKRSLSPEEQYRQIFLEKERAKKIIRAARILVEQDKARTELGEFEA